MSKDRNYISLHLHGGRTRKMLTLEIGRSHPYAMRLRRPEKVVEMVEKWLQKEWPSFTASDNNHPAKELLVELDEEGK